MTVQKFNEGDRLEPIVDSLPQYGTGGGTQVITNKPISNYKLRSLKEWKN